MSPTTPDDATVARSDTPAARETAIDVRFTPGTVVAERYRIVSLLGEGGMGEVYRADDIRLGQRVALKYVPARLANDPAALERLLHEIRIGRTVSHPNVCRMYDIVDTEGHRFIAMEYVDGEDLASLLRRIGQLPGPKAIAVARDISAGLAAAHDKGVVHRDLKPANIMIDGRGAARITDFGLAAIAQDAARSASDGAGTPAYMAPEQLAGQAVTERSDIYAFGVVLYEMFTGRRLFDAPTLEGLRQQHTTTKTRPSALAEGIDPAVERLILRCLEEDPAQRPSSMHAVIAALPGGDPLQAAIAAGETPSPQMVAAAGQLGDLPASRGWALVALLVLMVAAASWLSERASVVGYVRGIRRPDVLTDRARSIIQAFGYQPGTDSAGWLIFERAYLQWIRQNDHSTSRWERLQSTQASAIAFEYRDRDGFLIADSVAKPISRTDPAPIRPGDNAVIVDHVGRLRYFSHVPPAVSLEPAREIEWREAFVAAGYDPGAFRAVQPMWTPPVANDRRYAWSGMDSAASKLPIRIEAAGFGGKPVYFRVVPPWVKPALRPPTTVASIAFPLIAGGLLVPAVVIARRNAARGGADLRGAARLGAVVAISMVAATLLRVDHVADAAAEYSILITSIGMALYNGFYVFLAYCAIEPFVRRRYPRMLVGWSRLISGRVRDPLAGREVLIGLCAGAATLALHRGIWLIAMKNGATVPLNTLASWTMSAQFPAVYALAFNFGQAVSYTLGSLLLLLMFRLFFRSTVAAIAGAVVVWGLIGTYAGGWIDFANGVVTGAVIMALLFRSGALTAGAALFALFALRVVPLSLQFDQWHAAIALTLAAAIFGLAAAAFHFALAGKPLFGAITMDDETPA